MPVPIKIALPAVMVVLVLASGLCTGLISYFMTQPVVQDLVDHLDYTNLRGIRRSLQSDLDEPRLIAEDMSSELNALAARGVRLDLQGLEPYMRRMYVGHQHTSRTKIGGGCFRTTMDRYDTNYTACYSALRTPQMPVPAYRAEIMGSVNDINTTDMSWTMQLWLLNEQMLTSEYVGNYTIGFWHAWFSPTYKSYLDGVFVWVETDLDGVTKVPSIEFKYMWTHTIGNVNITFYMWLQGTTWARFLGTMRPRPEYEFMIVDSKSRVLVSTTVGTNVVPGDVPFCCLIDLGQKKADAFVEDVFSGLSSSGRLTQDEIGVLVTHGSKDYFVKKVNLEVGPMTWYIISTVPTDALTGPIKQATATSFGVMAAICVVSTGLVLVIALGVASIFESITLTVEDIAEMNLENTDIQGKTSSWTEVSRCLTGFQRVIANLVEYKSYMPQSLFAAAMEEDEEETKVVDDKSMSRSHQSSQVSGDRSLSKSGNHRKQSTAGGGGGQSMAGSRRSVKKAHATLSSATSTELKSKRISVVIVDMKKTHNSLIKNQDSVIANHSKFLTHVMETAHSTKGVPDTFCGDKVTVTFNAVTPCPTTPIFACNFMMGMKDIGVVCGSSCGMGTCGNMGVAGMKRFTVLGPVYNMAWLMMKLGKAWNHERVCDDTILKEATVNYVFCGVGVISAEKKRVVYVVVDKTQADSDEWMYQLEQQDSGNPYKTLTDAFTNLLSENNGGYVAPSVQAVEGNTFNMEAAVLRLKEMQTSGICTELPLYFL